MSHDSVLILKKIWFNGTTGNFINFSNHTAISWLTVNLYFASFVNTEWFGLMQGSPGKQIILYLLLILKDLFSTNPAIKLVVIVQNLKRISQHTDLFV